MPSLLLIGCGKLGSAMLTGWKQAGIPATSITVIKRNAPEIITAQHGVAAYHTLAEIPASFTPQAIILAVKPQHMAEILEPLSAWMKERTNGNTQIFVLSVAAGKTFAFFEEHLAPNLPIFRAMPNVGAHIQHSITAMIGNRATTEIFRIQAEGLMRAIGSVVWLTHESELDAVTATSGSGPAYVCYFLECMIAAAEALGLSPSLAQTLASETFFGTAELLKRGTLSPAELRTQVTSPNGTTQAALEILRTDHRFASLIKEALEAAHNRAQELGKI